MKAPPPSKLERRWVLTLSTGFHSCYYSSEEEMQKAEKIQDGDLLCSEKIAPYYSIIRKNWRRIKNIKKSGLYMANKTQKEKRIEKE
jgi:hypothetical protein